MAQVSEALFPRPLILHSTGVLRKSIYARGISRFSHINGEGIDENLTAKYTIMAHDGRASVQSTLDKLLLYRETLLDTSKRLAYDLLGPRTFDWSADMMTQDRINAASQEFVATYPVIGLGLAKDVFADVSSDANVLKVYRFSVIFNAEETLRAVLSSSPILLYSTLPEPLALVIHWLLRSWPLFRHVLLLRMILMSLLVGTPKLYKGLVLLGTGRFQAVFDSDVDDFVDMIWKFINGGFFVKPNEPTGKTGAGN